MIGATFNNTFDIDYMKKPKWWIDPLKKMLVYFDASWHNADLM